MCNKLFIVSYPFNMLFIMFPTNASNKNLYTSYFPQDAGKYTGYEKILYGSGFGRLCRELNYFVAKDYISYLPTITWNTMEYGNIVRFSGRCHTKSGLGWAVARKAVFWYDKDNDLKTPILS